MCIHVVGVDDAASMLLRAREMGLVQRMLPAYAVSYNENTATVFAAH